MMEIYLTIQEPNDVRIPDSDNKLAEVVSRLTKVASLVADSDFEPVFSQVTDAEGVVTVEFELVARDY